jgi:hypothetical protein
VDRKFNAALASSDQPPDSLRNIPLAKLLSKILAWPARLICSNLTSYDSSPLKQPNQEHDNTSYEQNMDCSSQDVTVDYAEQPEDE